MSEVHNYIYRNPNVTQKLEEMFNNEKYSDTIFLINSVQFYASSHLVSVSCTVLASELKIHFKNCGDREMRIGSIKHDSSFSIILKYIYGLQINFTDLEIPVLCESLSLSERFKLVDFSKEVKMYFSKLDCYQIDSLVPLLNTAKKFQIKELYEKLTIFAFENADQIVKHDTFADLNYDVLLELVKSDLFATLEVDILKSVLTWHSINIKEYENEVNGKEKKEEKYENMVLLEGANNFQNNPVLYSLQGRANISDNNPMLNTVKERPNSSDNNPVLNSLQEGPNISDNNPVFNSSTSNVQRVKCKELQFFSKNIMISLLSHIRFDFISVVQMFKFSNTELYTEYKDFFQDFKYSSSNPKCRKKLTGTEPVAKESLEQLAEVSQVPPEHVPEAERPSSRPVAKPKRKLQKDLQFYNLFN